MKCLTLHVVESNILLKVDWRSSCPERLPVCWRNLLSHQAPGSSKAPFSSVRSATWTPTHSGWSWNICDALHSIHRGGSFYLHSSLIISQRAGWSFICHSSQFKSESFKSVESYQVSWIHREIRGMLCQHKARWGLTRTSSSNLKKHCMHTLLLVYI